MNTTNKVYTALQDQTLYTYIFSANTDLEALKEFCLDRIKNDLFVDHEKYHVVIYEYIDNIEQDNNIGFHVETYHNEVGLDLYSIEYYFNSIIENRYIVDANLKIISKIF